MDKEIKFVGGISKKEYYKEYYQRPEVKLRIKEYNQRPEVKLRKRLQGKEYYQKNLKKIKDRCNNYYKRHEVKARRKEYYREYSKRPEVKQRIREYCRRPEVKIRQNRNQKLREYDITEKEYFEIMDKHQGRCAICNKIFKVPHIDHCHKRNKIRGVLCSNCNTGLGQFKDDPAILQSAIRYLKQAK